MSGTSKNHADNTAGGYIQDYLHCTACGACFNICPENAITWDEDNCGFKYPVINKELCIHCGLCSKVCTEKTDAGNNNNPKCYAVMCSDAVRKESTSGGVFKVLADWFLNNGGFVSGAVFAKDWSVEHIVSNKSEDIERMCGSKYVQSSIKYCYKEIKVLLEENKKVMFSGTPCQVAGLKNYLNKDYKELFCLDLLCHGVPSVKIFHKYLNDNFDINEIEDFKFRDKKFNGWGCEYSVTMNGKIVFNNEYFNNFISNICLRESCYNCSYNKLPRQGDMSIGNFWRIEKHAPDMTDGLGTSVVLINNKKGGFLFEILKTGSKKIKKIPLKTAAKCNRGINGCSIAHKDKDLFKKNFDDKADCLMLNSWWAVNYGAALTSWGPYCLMQELGMNPKVINFIPENKRVWYPKTFSDKFADKYLNLTMPCYDYEDLIKLNDMCDTFIAGSDQIWRTIIRDVRTPGVYLLDFVKSKNKKISYATSFGIGSLKAAENQDMVRLMHHFLPQYDSISVREYENKAMLKNELNLDCEQLIDGAFLIPKEKLIKMADEYPNKTGDYIALFYLPYLNDISMHRENISRISKKLDLPVWEWQFDRCIEVEKWLSFIKNAKFVITNSYHGVVLSIIFNVRFVQIINIARTQSRFNTLFKMLDTEDNSIGQNGPVRNIEEILVQRDWEKINNKIKTERQRAEDWMRKALSKPARDCGNDTLNYLIMKDCARDCTNAENTGLLANRKKILWNYRRYKIYSKIFRGKKRLHYERKRDVYKFYVRKIRELTGEGSKYFIGH